MLFLSTTIDECRTQGERITLPIEKKKNDSAPDEGLEPSTLRLRVSCSTDWANRATLYVGCWIISSIHFTRGQLGTGCSRVKSPMFLHRYYRRSIFVFGAEDGRRLLRNWVELVAIPDAFRVLFWHLQQTDRPGVLTIGSIPLLCRSVKRLATRSPYLLSSSTPVPFSPLPPPPSSFCLSSQVPICHVSSSWPVSVKSAKKLCPSNKSSTTISVLRKLWHLGAPCKSSVLAESVQSAPSRFATRNWGFP